MEPLDEIKKKRRNLAGVLIIMTHRDTGNFIIHPREICRGSITDFYNKKMRYESVWYE
jgi:hypothetical protein